MTLRLPSPELWKSSGQSPEVGQQLGALTDGAVRLTPVSLVFIRDPTWDEWCAVGAALAEVDRAYQWWIGDWWAHGDHGYGERAAQALDSNTWAFQTFMDAGWVARKFTTSRRREVLSFSHHREVAALDPAEQDALLDTAERNGWSRNELRKAVRAYRRALAASQAGPLPKGMYRVIYADPPWHYDQQVEGYGPAEAHYLTMETPDIMAMPVEERAASDAVLFLWSTVPKHEEALGVMAAWGFAFRAEFIWDKVLHNYGHYNSVRHEILLIGRRGQPPQVGSLIDSVVELERTAHSRKPERFREIIDEMYPPPDDQVDRIELFARGTVPKWWRSWGDEVAAASGRAS